MHHFARRAHLPLCTVALGLAVGQSGCQPKKSSPNTASPRAVDAEQPNANAATTQLSTQSELGKEVLATMDLGADPCQDFYRYACGGWLDRTELPSDKPRFGRGFGVVRERNLAALRGLLEKAKSAPGDEGKAGSYYAACMDQATVDAQGVKGLSAVLKEIEKIKRTKDLVKFLGKYQDTLLGSSFISAGTSNDFKNPDLYILGVGQGTLGLRDRSYYLDAKQKPILDQYAAHIERMLTKLGYTDQDAKKAAAAIITVETELAKISKPRDQLRDPEKLYHPMSQKEFEALAPKLYIKEFLKAANYPKLDSVNVSLPDYVKALPDVLAKAEFNAIRHYLKFLVIDHNADLLTQDIIETRFEFSSKLSGAKSLPPRWKHCVGATTAAYEDIVAQIYVKARFPGESKNTSLTMIQDIERAFEARLVDLKWMDQATRDRAVEKMKAIGNKVGYPDKWRDYSGLDANKGYFDNAMAARSFERKKSIEKIGTKVDESKWFIPASMVNAFYSPLQNEIVFPAGILQPPYFSQSFPRAMNYGAMGMVMGHELTHGFDDSGRKFDGQGIMREWWDPSVAKRFEAQAKCIENAYSAVEIQPGVNINGKLTLGENIADFGGIKYAYHGYQEWTRSHGKEAPIIDGMSNEQLLFVAFAQGWCTKSAPEFDRRMILLDPHSPPKERVNLPLAHFSGFWETFSCAAGTPMHPKNSCEVW